MKNVPPLVELPLDSFENKFHWYVCLSVECLKTCYVFPYRIQTTQPLNNNNFKMANGLIMC